MEAKELRIGNWVNICVGAGLEQQVIDLMCDCINTKYHECAPFDLIYPIPITHEWFEKFGAVKDKHYNVHYTLPLNGDYGYVMFVKNGDNSYMAFLHIGDSSVLLYEDIEYVHQLQNLYFAISGEELTLK